MNLYMNFFGLILDNIYRKLHLSYMEQCALLLQCGNSNQSRMKNRCSFLPVLGNIFLFYLWVCWVNKRKMIPSSKLFQGR